MPDRTRESSRSLTRQSVMVAGFCLLADTLTFYYDTAGTLPATRLWGLMTGLVLVDAALASAARLSGLVALAQAMLALIGALAMPDDGTLTDLNGAGTLIAAYRSGAWLHGRQAALALMYLAAGSIGAHMIAGPAPTDWRVLVLDAVKEALLAWLVGRYTTARGAHIAELEQRTARERERARHALADAIVEERSAIARDLHDVIAHHVSAIGVHAGAARLGIDAKERSPVSTALAAVEASSRAALLDLRRLLDFLHNKPAADARQPGLDDLDELIRSVAAAGLDTRVLVEGDRQALEGSLDIAVYRVVQELLTNALRHGDGQVAITLRYATSSITVVAVNPIAAARRFGHDTPHRGLQGVSSRAGLFDGSATYGPTPGGSEWKTTVTFSLDGT
ncbi:sensor histidine kinase [Streptomyces sp. CoH17]|uniref:sensor histidine kinase n=1 Tax=Streptomyces sp. CoH17 TaxID=2992806 RepID=UPI00226F5EB5|nr:histidine kinase [Streptomyces sp. CoH17]